MIQHCVDLLEDVPGYQQTEYMKKMRKFKETEKMARSTGHDSKVIGASTLTRNRDNLKAQREARDAEDDSAESGEEDAKGGNKAESRKVSKDSASVKIMDGADVTNGVNKDGTDLNKAEAARDGTDVNKDGVDTKKQSRKGKKKKNKEKEQRGLTEWDVKATQDRKERMMDPAYKASNQVYESLYWLVKIKSDMYWQQPLRDIIQDMQQSCLDELIDVTVDSKLDMLRIIGQLTSKYELKEEVHIGEADSRVKIKKGSHLLPLGVLTGKNLQDSDELAKFEDIPLPAYFVMGLFKGDCTRQKTWFMKSRHSLGLVTTARHLTWVMNSLDELFKEVTEDLKMTASLEAVMECPPTLSRLFLPFSGNVAEDAETPRDDEEEPGGDLDRGMSQSFAATKTMTMGSMSSLPEASRASGFAASGDFDLNAPVKKAKKLERNQVLTMAANYARTVKQEQAKVAAAAAAAAPAGGPALNKRGTQSLSMFASSAFTSTFG